jgi:hypothetical protein
MKIIISSLRRLSFELNRASEAVFWAKKIKDRFGIPSKAASNVDQIHWILRETYNILYPIPPELIKACEISAFIFRFLGISKPKFPNHGYYRESDKSITLNTDIFIHPDQPEDFIDDKGYFLTRAEETLLHEMGHSLDAALGNISTQSAWMKLSGWSKEPKPGLERLCIKDKGTPDVIGEMYYDPKFKADGFTRFYARRNPWDDFADSFSMWLGLKDKVPATKARYLDNLLKKYY